MRKRNMKIKQKNGFTLVELLAVIVILAIILVIAVPKVMSVIEDSKKATLESTAKMIASAAEKAIVQNTVLGKEEAINCEDVVKLNDVDYEYCSIQFDNNTAKVIIEGSGKFTGLYVCGGTKTNTKAKKEECTDFELDDWATIVYKVKSGIYPYQVGDTKIIDLGDELGEHTIRVVNTTKCSDEWMDDVTKSQTACGFVLEFVDIITKHAMNGTDKSSSTNVGGWPASEMRIYLNDLDVNSSDDGVIYNALPDELRNGIINTYVVSSHGCCDEGTIGENKNFASTDKLYLLSTEEVWAQGDSNTIDFDTSRGTSRQLDYYANNNVTTSNYGAASKIYGEEGVYWWWLRSARYNFNNSFYRLAATDELAGNYSYMDRGVAPAFRLAD